jgi:hypothetical protein
MLDSPFHQESLAIRGDAVTRILVLILALGLLPAAAQANPIVSFTFTDRPDSMAGDNNGLVPTTFGFASGLVVTFSGPVQDPVLQAAPPGAGTAAVSVVGGNSVVVGFGRPVIAPTSVGDVAGPANRLTVQVTGSSGAVAPTQILWTAPVQNVIPRSLSAESNLDSEPSLAVNPVGGPLARTIALTTFTRSDGATISSVAGLPWSVGQAAPVFVSSNGGLSWSLQARVPVPPGGAVGPLDQTIAYTTDGSALHGAFLTSKAFFVPATPDPATTNFSGTGSFTFSGLPDQPRVVAARVNGQDRVYVGFNDKGALPASASVIVSTDGGSSFQAPVRIDTAGTVANQDAPAVRLAVNGDRVYAAFMRYTAAVILPPGQPPPPSLPGDVVVVRDSAGGVAGPGNPTPFANLGPGGQGVIVQQGDVPFNTSLGQERIVGSDLTIAVDPHNPDVVYVACDLVNSAGTLVLHVQRSRDGGATWQELLTIENAALPALAVADNGSWGLLCTRLDGGRMITEFLQNGGPARTLTSWPFDNPPGLPDIPYIGDYQYLLAVDNTFYGTFSASNAPPSSLNDLEDGLGTDFPFGVVFQRNADFPESTLFDPASVQTIPPSIDPYFFSIAAEASIPEPGTALLVGLGLAYLAECRTMRVLKRPRRDGS